MHCNGKIVRTWQYFNWMFYGFRNIRRTSETWISELYKLWNFFQGAFWGLMIGLVVGLIRFIWEYSYTVPPCGEEDDDNRPSIIKDVHYLHFGCILFVIVIISTIIISLLTPPIDDKHVSKLRQHFLFDKYIRFEVQKTFSNRFSCNCCFSLKFTKFLMIMTA